MYDLRQSARGGVLVRPDQLAPDYAAFVCDPDGHRREAVLLKTRERWSSGGTGGECSVSGR